MTHGPMPGVSGAVTPSCDLCRVLYDLESLTSHTPGSGALRSAHKDDNYRASGQGPGAGPARAARGGRARYGFTTYKDTLQTYKP